MKKYLSNPWIKWPLIGIGIVLGLFFGLYASVYFGVWGKVPSTDELSNLSQMQASQIYDKDQVLIGKFYITDRETVKFDNLPTDLIHALVATEDARFYEHSGIDEKSLVRVFFKSILMGDKSSGGGSTITLQLAKNLYGRKKYGRLGIVINKLRESIVAKRLESIYSKNEILTLYFNTVPFSGNTYGIESASQKFFSKHAKDLNLSEAATLVGTLKANHSYNPRLFPERSQLRRDVVLKQMVKHQYITNERAEKVMAEKINIDFHNYSSGNALAAYFKEQIRKKVEHILSDEKYKKPDGTAYNIKTDGLKIYTTLDAKLQQYAEKSMRDRMSKLQKQFESSFGQHSPWRRNSSIVKKAITKLPRYKKLKKEGLDEKTILDSLNIPKETELFAWKENIVKNISPIDSLRYYLKFLNTGLVSIDPQSGAVRAYIGGINYGHFQYDHVVQSRREVGSTFKPFVYAAALENGLRPCDYFKVKEVTYTDQDGWTPKNAEKNIDPELKYSMTAALTHSINTIAVKVLQETGIDQVIDQVHKMGIKEEIVHKPAIALGVSDIKLIDMATAYSSFLNKNQQPVEPYFITKIEDHQGHLIVDFDRPKERKPAFSKETQQIMLQMLQSVVDKGTAGRLRNTYHFSNAIAGKTGTTQHNTDGWFVGLLPNLVTVTWVGNDNHNIKFNSTAIGQGANTALPIFAGMLQQMNQDSDFNYITKSQFSAASKNISDMMDCPPTKRSGFFERLFDSGKKEKTFKKKKKKGFFNRLFDKK